MAMCPSCNRFVSATMNKDYTVQVEFDEYMIYLSVSHNGCQFQSIRIKDPLVEIPQIVMALASYYYNHVMPQGSAGERERMTAIVNKTALVLELANVHGVSGEMEIGTVTVRPTDVLDLMLEVEQLRLANKKTYCAYCGAEFPIDDPGSVEAVGLHIATCEKHPMRRSEAEVKRLRAELERARDDLASELLHMAVASLESGKGPLTVIGTGTLAAIKEEAREEGARGAAHMAYEAAKGATKEYCALLCEIVANDIAAEAAMNLNGPGRKLQDAGIEAARRCARAIRNSGNDKQE